MSSPGPRRGFAPWEVTQGTAQHVVPSPKDQLNATLGGYLQELPARGCGCGSRVPAARGSQNRGGIDGGHAGDQELPPVVFVVRPRGGIGSRVGPLSALAPAVLEM
ncbi:hypothetical protein R1flu_021592 [Riccia fluitans]|uniref:Uncharacterized protein n=1 Tax=Riccia fluitans TaxID=41844 RepID=A0ABD1ZT06_9MARC